MNEIVLPIRPHDGQQRIIASSARYTVIAAGRRFGKTEACKVRAIIRAVTGNVWWVSPTYSAGTDTWRDFKGVFEGVSGVGINHSERRIWLPTGGQLRMVAADAFKRGAGVTHVFVDEAAFLSPTLWAYELQPMLLESKGGADFLSSPNGRNWFWALFQRGLDPAQPLWAAYQFTSYDSPLLDNEEIERVKASVPQRVFEQEYLAKFLDDGGAVFRNLQACVQPAQSGTASDVVFGVDLGRHHDYSVVIAIDASTGRMVDMDRFTDVAWDVQALRIDAMAQRWQPSRIIMEENFNDSFVERLQGDGLPIRPFRTTASSKAQLVNQLALAFEQGDIGILNDPVLLGELQAYTMERLPGGSYRYTAPAGLHDDTVMALALAWHGVSAPRIVRW